MAKNIKNQQNKPSVDILALLISLYADQEGIEITYKLKEKDNGQQD